MGGRRREVGRVAGVVVPFTFISYLDCSYYTTEGRETFGEKKLLISSVAEGYD